MNFSENGEHEEEISVQVISLIDILFVLLLFFMVTTSFVAAPGFKVDLPKSAAKDIERDKKDMTIVIDANHSIIFNQKKVTEKELQDKLFAQSQIDPQSLVIIQADQNITHGEVVRIMDYARAAGLVRLAIATAPKSP